MNVQEFANRVLFYPHNLAPSSPCLSVCLSVCYATVSRERDLKRRGRNEHKCETDKCAVDDGVGVREEWANCGSSEDELFLLILLHW
jgi:hypothetical protein